MKLHFLGIGAGLVTALGAVAFNVTDRVQGSLVEVEPTSTYIIKADTSADAAKAVKAVQGVMIGELSVIDSATAVLTDMQADALRRREGLQVYKDAQVEVSGEAPDTFYPAACSRRGACATRAVTERTSPRWRPGANSLPMVSMKV